MKFLIIEDNDLVRQGLRHLLKDLGQVDSYASPLDISSEVYQNQAGHDLIIIDLDLDRSFQGLELLDKFTYHKAYKVILTGHDDQGVIQTAYDKGADDYLVKPFNKTDILGIVSKLEKNKISDVALKVLKEVGLSEQGQEVFKRSLKANLPLIIDGETGTGKTTMAKFWHQSSSLCDGPFMALNCSAFSEGILESELFGHSKGSFTGASQERKGKLELADGGTLFLDEVHTMSKSLQAKLLKAIEEKTFYPVGSEKPVRSDFFLISAGSQSLSELVERGDFREDLYFRLKGLCLKLPSLKETPERLEQMLEKFAHEGRRRRVFTKEALRALLNYTWPGNLREFQKELEVLRLLDKNKIELSDLPEGIQKSQSLSLSQAQHYELNSWNEIEKLGLKKYLEKIEKELVVTALGKNKGKVRKTIEQLSISSHAFYRALGKS